MWFEILPTFVIITVVMAVPHGFSYVINRLVNGNGYRRSLLTDELQRQYLRDKRITGDVYNITTLDDLPEEEQCIEEEEKCSCGCECDQDEDQEFHAEECKYKRNTQ